MHGPGLAHTTFVAIFVATLFLPFWIKSWLFFWAGIASLLFANAENVITVVVVIVTANVAIIKFAKIITITTIPGVVWFIVVYFLHMF